MTLRVCLVAGAGVEERAAEDWLRAQPNWQVRRVEPEHLEAALRDCDVVWIHATTRPTIGEVERIKTFAAPGGGVLLTLRAAELVGPLGIESVPPNDCGEQVWRHAADEGWQGQLPAMRGYPHGRGVATYGPHPLVAGLHNGTYCWAPSEGERYAWACYAGGARPADGRVVGVERAYIVQNPERIVAWEYRAGVGRIVCIGAYVYFAAPDGLLRPQLERLVVNAIQAATPQTASATRTSWPLPGTAAAASEALALPEPLDLDGGLPTPAGDPIALVGEVEADEQFDLAGRRLLLVGGERRGISEIWCHPHRAAASWDVDADGERAVGTRIEVSPDVVVRTIETASRRMLETSFVALEQAFVIVEYRAARKNRESVGRGPAHFEVSLTMDLRRMWPFAAGCGGNLRYRRASSGLVALVESERDDGVAAVFLSRPAAIELQPHAGPAPVVKCVVGAPLDVPLRIAIVGGVNRDDLERTLRGIRRLGVAGLVRQRAQRAAVFTEARFAVRGEDLEFVRALEWAKRRMDAFLVDTPGVGRSLVGGYAPSTPGWGDGRPGYGWYFGRDACWTAFGLLAIGEFSAVRQVLRFLGDRQDVTGKVLHEATTSGQFHYDAADSTPLYLLLVARYLAWTGDREFVASIWPKVERAYHYCVGTDTDGDGLIENTRVGHGWIESGPLGGGQVTLYLAAVWRAALEGLAAVAETLGHERVAAECWTRAARATSTVETSFYDEARGIYALNRRADGTYTWTQTAMAAVPILLRAVNPVRVRSYLDALSGEGFSAPWGVRMLPPGDPLFTPTGYHAGAVWPLYTGWAALAEYAMGRGEAAFRHLTANAELAYARQRGAFDEVLHGTEERGIGACPDQAWSASMVVQPLVEGLLGAVPDAPHGRLIIAPQLPASWSRLEVLGLRCGESVYDLTLRRDAQELTVGVRRTLGPALWMTLAPWCAALPTRVLLDDQELRPDVSAWGDGLRVGVSLEAAAEHELKVVV